MPVDGLAREEVTYWLIAIGVGFVVVLVVILLLTFLVLQVKTIDREVTDVRDTLRHSFLLHVHNMSPTDLDLECRGLLLLWWFNFRPADPAQERRQSAAACPACPSWTSSPPSLRPRCSPSGFP